MKLKEGMMDRLIIGVEKCTACRACELACSFTHENVFAPQLSRIRVVRFMDKGLNVPMVCVNCARPACVDACPTGAVYVGSDGRLVRINAEECIGCGECVRACPFGTVDFDEDKGVAFMCDYCDGDPACVKECKYGALTFRPGHQLAQRKRQAAAEVHSRLEEDV
jgi:Fe-S-cluster-containing dehydrogenase component